MINELQEIYKKYTNDIITISWVPCWYSDFDFEMKSILDVIYDMYTDDKYPTSFSWDLSGLECESIFFKLIENCLFRLPKTIISKEELNEILHKIIPNPYWYIDYSTDMECGLCSRITDTETLKSIQSSTASLSDLLTKARLNTLSVVDKRFIQINITNCILCTIISQNVTPGGGKCATQYNHPNLLFNIHENNLSVKELLIPSWKVQIKKDIFMSLGNSEKYSFEEFVADYLDECNTTHYFCASYTKGFHVINDKIFIYPTSPPVNKTFLLSKIFSNDDKKSKLKKKIQNCNKNTVTIVNHKMNYKNSIFKS